MKKHYSAWCTYTLCGWDANNVPYYEASCQSGYRRYNPANGEIQRTSALPEDMKINPADESETDPAQRFISSKDVEGFDPSAVYPVFAYNGIVSPDGEWQAVAFREFYGPHDIVVLHARQQ